MVTEAQGIEATVARRWKGEREGLEMRAAKEQVTQRGVEMSPARLFACGAR